MRRTRAPGVGVIGKSSIIIHVWQTDITIRRRALFYNAIGHYTSKWMYGLPSAETGNQVSNP